jgi:membrane protein DedA with SNARE-associated domain
MPQQEWIFTVLQSYAYEPLFVYALVFGLMIASGFGFPMPEEVTIVSVGILAYMGAHPELYPPPYPGARPLGGYEAAAVTTASIAVADVLVFSLGRKFGRPLMAKPRIRELFGEKIMSKVNQLMARYGIYAAFMFRFAPGLRVPAHIAMGASHFPLWQFALVDGLAAAISVPTQILLIYHFGDEILYVFREFKIVVLSVVAVVVVYFVAKKIWTLWKVRNSKPSVPTP